MRWSFAPIALAGALLLAPLAARAQTAGVTVRLTGNLPAAAPLSSLLSLGAVCANSGTVSLPAGYAMVIPCNSVGQVVVSGSGSGGSVLSSVAPLTYVTPDSLSVGTTSTAMATAGKYTTSLQVCTLPASTTNVWLNVRGAAAVVGAGVPVFSGGGCANFGTQALPVPTAAINAITDNASAQTVTMAGG